MTCPTARARMVVRHSFLDGAIPNPPTTQSFAVRPQGDVDALIERNVIRRAGGACIFVVTRADLGGELNVDILNNDLDECHPTGRVSAILVGPVGVNLPSPTRPLTATGTVNIVGNTIRNSTDSASTARFMYEVYTGRIERNRIVDVVKPCATPTSKSSVSDLDRTPHIRVSVSAGGRHRAVQRHHRERARRPSGRAEPDDSDRRVVQLLGIAVGTVGYRRWRRRRDSRRTGRRHSRVHAVCHAADCRTAGQGLLSG